MKKVLVTLLLAMSVFAISAKAQVSPGHYAMDFTLTPLNNDGVPVHLYEWLDAGKTVIMDISATWCSPCWSFHNSGILESLWAEHGPGTATDDIRVVYVEGDPSTTDADMRGETSGSQGNWLDGTEFPMCNPGSADVALLDEAYQYTYFPTLFIICPNRSVMQLTQSNYLKVVNNQTVYKTGEEVYNYIKSITCPDLIQYEASFKSLALAGPTITFNNTFGFNLQVKNTGAMDLDSFTVVLKGDNTTYSSYTWNTKLAPFAYSDAISLTSDQFAAGTSYVSMELIPHTNVDTVASVSRLKVASYSNATKYTLPFAEDFETKNDLPALFGLTPALANNMFSVVDSYQFNSGTVEVIGADGTPTKAIGIPFYNLNTDNANWVGIMSIGNFDAMTAVDTIKFEFDYAYRMYPGQTKYDKLEVVYSTDQGSTWKSAWSKSGTGLATIDTSSSFFVPSDADQWKHITTIVKVAGKENVVVGLRATSGYGNNCFVDNLKLYGIAMNPTEDPQTAQIGIFPNPAKESFSVRGYNGAAKLFDVTGRLVWSGNVTDGESINIESLVPGVYYINLSGNIQKFVKQ